MHFAYNSSCLSLSFISVNPLSRVPFVSDSSPKRIHREGLGESRTGTREKITHVSQFNGGRNERSFEKHSVLVKVTFRILRC